MRGNSAVTIMRETILALIENADTWTRLRLGTTLGQEGYEVIWVETADDAVSAYRRQHVDLFLLDFGRPLRAAWGDFEHVAVMNPDLPVVLLTEQKTEFERAVGERTGAVLEKPLHIPALIHTIHVLLGKPPREHPARSGSPTGQQRTPHENTV